MTDSEQANGSGYRLHQATARARIIIVILRIVLPQGVNTKGGSSNKTRQQAKGARGTDRIDEFAHGSLYLRTTVTKNCAMCRDFLMFLGHSDAPGFKR